MNNRGLEALAALASAAPPSSESSLSSHPQQHRQRQQQQQQQQTTDGGVGSGSDSANTVPEHQHSHAHLMPQQHLQQQATLQSFHLVNANNNQQQQRHSAEFALLQQLQRADPNMAMALNNMAYYQAAALLFQQQQQQHQRAAAAAAGYPGSHFAALLQAHEQSLAAGAPAMAAAPTSIDTNTTPPVATPQPPTQQAPKPQPPPQEAPPPQHRQQPRPRVVVPTAVGTAGVMPPPSGSTARPPSPVMAPVQGSRSSTGSAAGNTSLTEDEEDVDSHGGSALPTDSSGHGNRKEQKRAANRRSAQLSRKRKKQFIEELKDENDDLRRKEQILRSIPDLVVVFDSTGRLWFVSQSIRRFIDYTPAELEGRSFWERLCPESVRLLKAAFMDSLAAQGNAAVDTVPLGEGLWDLRLMDKDGTFVTVTLNGVVHFAGERPECVCCIRPKDNGASFTNDARQQQHQPARPENQQQHQHRMVSDHSTLASDSLNSQALRKQQAAGNHKHERRVGAIRISDSGNSSGSGDSESGSSDELNGQS